MSQEKKVVVLQSNYIPWRGYFDLIRDADLFIFYDEVQFTKNDWRNRNKILTASGPIWLSIPVGQNIKRKISEVEILESAWQAKHWKTIYQNYKKSPFFSHFADFFEDFYLKNEWKNLSELNQYLIVNIAREFLKLKTSFECSSAYSLNFTKGDRLLDLLKQVNATTYITGPAALDYLNQEQFIEHNIKLVVKEYNYMPYPQAYPSFVNHLSVVDTLFNCGNFLDDSFELRDCIKTP